ncbi:MAG TPA: hypothetical protein VEY93_04175 [Longimicrobium sp.]|jgi:hypothetical protein|nr:hypothetical protein [Longimicrobium sp.]
MTWLNWLKELVELPFSIPQKRRMRERGGYTKADFVRHFGRDGAVAGVVWDCLAGEAVVENFKPHPEDDLSTVFGLADEDLDDVVLRALHEAGCRVPSPAETATMPPVRTVADMVGFLADMRLG